MKILYLTPFNPAIRDGGGYLRSAYMWKALRSIGIVDTVVVSGDGEPYRDMKERIWTSSVKSAFRFRLRLLFLQLLSAFRCRMDWAFLDRSEILKLLGCESGDYDCVVVRYEYLARKTAAWKIAPLFLDFDDLPSEAFETIYMPKMSMIVGKVRLILLKWWERFIALQCAGVWLANPDKLDELPLSVRKSALRNIGCTPSRDYDTGKWHDNSIVAIGAYGYEPNRVGMEWFLSDVWPIVRQRIPSLKLHVVGSIPECHRATAEHWAGVQGVKVLGFVDDINSVYEKALCSVAPVTVGSGTCVKVIESATFGRRVLATPFAARGISVEDLERLGVSVFKNADEFSESVLKLLSENTGERSQRQLAIKAYANRKFSFDSFRDMVADMVLDRDGLSRSCAQ